jgi:type II secretory pathway component PulC
MKRIPIVLSFLVLQACQPTSNSSPDPKESMSTSIPRKDWARFIATLRSDFGRNVPQVRGEAVVGVKYYGLPVPAAQQLGLHRGDMVVAFNGADFSEDPRKVIEREMDRSLEACTLSFTLDINGTRRELRANCS